LTGEPGTQNVYRLQRAPHAIEFGEVPQVWDMAVRPRIVEEPGREYPVTILVDLGVPRDGRLVISGDSEVQTAVA